MANIGTVLLIEDDSTMEATVPEFLSASGFLVKLAQDVGEALQQMHAQRFDVIVVDSALDEPDFHSEIRTIDPHMEIIVLAEQADAETRGLGPVDTSCTYLQKPVHLPALLNYVRSSVTTRSFHRHVDYLLTSSGQEGTPLGESVRIMEQLLWFDRELMAIMDYRRVVDTIMSGTLELAKPDAVALLVVHERVSTEMVLARDGARHPSRRDLEKSMIANWEVWGGKPLRDTSPVWSGHDETNTAPVNDMVVVPLMAHDNIVGVLGAFATEKESLPPEAEVLVPFLAGRAEVVVENVFLHEHTKILATTDALTGLMNRRVFIEGISREFERARRYAMSSSRSGGELSVIMLDVDKFKDFNDTYGHQLGDKVLKTVANVLLNAVRRATDIVGRYGGEEFVVVLPDTTLANGVLLAERMRRSLESTSVDSSHGPLHVTASFGVSAFPECGPKTVEMLIEQADEAQYRAKRNGRNRVESARTVDEDKEAPVAADARP